MKTRNILIISAFAVTTAFALIALDTQQSAFADESAAQKADPMQFARGAKTWADTCVRCHNMRDPKSLRDDQWRAAMAHMRVRAGLTAGEAEDVLLFLQQSN